jgi:hypothetical protein
MATPTLTQVFGSNATQTATQLIISKNDLVVTGLSASATNSADSLLAAIIAFSQSALADANVTTNVGQTIGIADSFQSITTISSTNYLVTSKTVNFYKPFTSGGFDPDDY